MNNRKAYETLTLANQFMFSKVMKNEKLCKQLLEVILGEKIDKIRYIETEKTIDLKVDAHGIRLDAYVKGNNEVIYNVEMQTSDTKNHPKRSRYYQGVIDLNLLERGVSYNNLNRSFVIFICTFDYFKRGRHIYTFNNYCDQDRDLILGDEATKIFLNPYSDMNDVNEELDNFLRYLVSGEPTDDFTKALDNEVIKAKENKEWRVEYMQFSCYMDDIKQDAREEGREEGLEAVIEIIKSTNPNITFEELYGKVIQTKNYQNVTQERVKRYW